jgi:ATP-dependent protease HslVU (ClpYQ) peptidase subunit
MTCIVAWIEEDKKKVWMGGDTLGVGGLGCSNRKDVKVKQVGNMLIGFTTSFRMGQLLHFEFTPPKHDPELEDYAYMVTKVVPAIRKVFKEGGYAKVEFSQESGGTFLIGYRGSIYEIYSDFQVGVPAKPYASVGCGDDLALGAFHALDSIVLPGDIAPEERIELALKAAEEFSAGVRGPFTIESIDSFELVKSKGRKRN